MKKKANLLAVERPRARTEQERAAWDETEAAWRGAQDSFRISSTEIAKRIGELRSQLKDYADQVDAAPFSVPFDYISGPRGDRGDQKEPLNLIECVNPIVDGLFRAIDAYAAQYGCHNKLDFNAKLFELKMHAAETGFQVGVLAGAFFAGAPGATIDKLERGLSYALANDSRICREVKP